jgi:hypothetical protein
VPDSLLVTTPRQPPHVHGILTLDEALRLAASFHPDSPRPHGAPRPLSTRAGCLAPAESGRGGTVENFGGGIGSDHVETTITATQTFPLGGARGARIAIARPARRRIESRVMLDTLGNSAFRATAAGHGRNGYRPRRRRAAWTNVSGVCDFICLR